MSSQDQDLIERLKQLPISKLGLALLIAEEVAREISEKIPKPRDVATRIIDRNNVVVDRTLDIIKTTSRGRLIELVIRSPTNNFGIAIISDNVPKINRRFDELMLLSQISETISAFKEAETEDYVLHIKNIYWTENFLATIYTNEKTIMKNIFAIWEEII